MNEGEKSCSQGHKIYQRESLGEVFPNIKVEFYSNFIYIGLLDDFKAYGLIP